MARRFFSCTACIAALALCCTLAAAAENDAKKFPFFPSMITTDTGKPVTPDKFESPEICAGCHPEIHAQWKGSMHSNAFVDPVFQALWQMGEKDTKGFTKNLCGGCHTVVGVVSGDLTFKDNQFVTSEIARQGVQCDVCHTIKDSSFLETPTYEPNNASLIVAPGNVKRGPYKDSVSPYHKSEYSELHTKSKFCANCHQVFHPVSNFHIERTYDEWKYSVYAQNDIQCQDCHMMPVEKSIEVAKTMKKPINPGQPSPMGPKRDNMFTHEFVGANFTVPALLGAKGHADMAEKRLKSAAELDILAPKTTKPGSMVTMGIKVSNVGAGHNLPTSLTEVRQMWLDIKVTDVQGKEVFRSGALDEKGDLGEDARIFCAYAVDKDGKHTVKPWEIVRFEYVKTIPPKGSATETFSFLTPADAKLPLDVRVVLRYRSYPQSVANLLLGKDAPVLPIVDMVEKNIKMAAN